MWQTQSFEVLFNVNTVCFTTASAFFGIFSHRKDGFPHHSVGGFSLGLLGKLAQTAVVKLHPGVLVGIYNRSREIERNFDGGCSHSVLKAVYFFHVQELCFCLKNYCILLGVMDLN